MSTMYSLTAEYLELMNMASDGEVPDDVIKDTFEGLDGEFEDKADNCLKIVKEFKGRAEMIGAEIKRLQALEDSYSNAAKRVLKSVENSMILTGKTKFKTNFASYWIQKNPAKVVVDKEVDVNLLPAEYLTFKDPEVNKAEVKKALENGVDLAWAHIEQTESIRTR